MSECAPGPPIVTVAVPTYNGARHVGEAIQSILAQAGVAFRLIVNDDGSTDDTLAVVREAAAGADVEVEVEIEVNSRRHGHAGNWNRCLERSETRLTAIFHQDDRMLPGHLLAHVQAFLATDDDVVALVASRTETIDAAGRRIEAMVVDPGGLAPPSRRFGPGGMVGEMAERNPLRCSAVTLRTEAAQAVGGFDGALGYVVDWDLWLRVAEAYATAWVDQTTVAIRWHPASETHTFKTGLRDLEESAALIDRLLAGRPELEDRRGPALRRLARAYLNRSYEGAKAGNSALCRLALRRAVSLDRGVLLKIAAEPRLAARIGLGLAGWRGPRVGVPEVPAVDPNRL